MSQKAINILFEISELLKNSGVINHRSEARAIVAKVLNREVNRVHPAIDIEITDTDYVGIKKLAERRASGEPLQLITGCVGFYNCILKCEIGVFIPRIETELLVDVALKYLYDYPPDLPARVLDLACGCGAVSIALALSAPKHHYYGIDASEKAVELASQNAELNGVADKINFMKGDYFDPVRSWDDVKFDVITANPPYIKSGDINGLSKDVREWDPDESLDGGPDGLEHYGKFGLELHKFLSVDGVAIFEIDPGYVKPLENIFIGSGLEIRNVYKDFDGNDRAMEVIVKKSDNEDRLLTDLK